MEKEYVSNFASGLKSWFPREHRVQRSGYHLGMRNENHGEQTQNNISVNHPAVNSSPSQLGNCRFEAMGKSQPLKRAGGGIVSELGHFIRCYPAQHRPKGRNGQSWEIAVCVCDQCLLSSWLTLPLPVFRHSPWWCERVFLWFNIL